MLWISIARLLFRPTRVLAHFLRCVVVLAFELAFTLKLILGLKLIVLKRSLTHHPDQMALQSPRGECCLSVYLLYFFRFVCLVSCYFSSSYIPLPSFVYLSLRPHTLARTRCRSRAGAVHFSLVRLETASSFRLVILGLVSDLGFVI